jgi:hypothetical protein
MKLSDVQGRLSQDMQEFSDKLVGLATSAWQTLKKHPEVTQEIAKDPFTAPVKEQSATAELLILLLHACDRVASATFGVALPEQTVAVLRNAFMSALVGATVPAFVRAACPDDDQDEQEETEADLLHLYNARVTQYGYFPLGNLRDTEQPEPLLALAGIRLAEALECPENAEIISHGVELVMASLSTLRTQLPLKDTIGKLIAGAHEKNAE